MKVLILLALLFLSFFGAVMGSNQEIQLKGWNVLSEIDKDFNYLFDRNGMLYGFMKHDSTVLQMCNRQNFCSEVANFKDPILSGAAIQNNAYICTENEVWEAVFPDSNATAMNFKDLWLLSSLNRELYDVDMKYSFKVVFKYPVFFFVSTKKLDDVYRILVAEYVDNDDNSKVFDLDSESSNFIYHHVNSTSHNFENVYWINAPEHSLVAVDFVTSDSVKVTVFDSFSKVFESVSSFWVDEQNRLLWMVQGFNLVSFDLETQQEINHSYLGQNCILKIGMAFCEELNYCENGECDSSISIYVLERNHWLLQNGNSIDNYPAFYQKFGDWNIPIVSSPFDDVDIEVCKGKRNSIIFRSTEFSVWIEVIGLPTSGVKELVTTKWSRCSAKGEHTRSVLKCAYRDDHSLEFPKDQCHNDTTPLKSTCSPSYADLPEGFLVWNNHYYNYRAVLPYGQDLIFIATHDFIGKPTIERCDLNMKSCLTVGQFYAPGWSPDTFYDYDLQNIWIAGNELYVHIYDQDAKRNVFQKANLNKCLEAGGLVQFDTISLSSAVRSEIQKHGLSKYFIYVRDASTLFVFDAKSTLLVYSAQTESESDISRTIDNFTEEDLIATGTQCGGSDQLITSFNSHYNDADIEWIVWDDKSRGFTFFAQSKRYYSSSSSQFFHCPMLMNEENEPTGQLAESIIEFQEIFVTNSVSAREDLGLIFAATINHYPHFDSQFRFVRMDPFNAVETESTRVDLLSLDPPPTYSDIVSIGVVGNYLSVGSEKSKYTETLLYTFDPITLNTTLVLKYNGMMELGSVRMIIGEGGSNPYLMFYRAITKIPHAYNWSVGTFDSCFSAVDTLTRSVECWNIFGELQDDSLCEALVPKPATTKTCDSEGEFIVKEFTTWDIAPAKSANYHQPGEPLSFFLSCDIRIFLQDRGISYRDTESELIEYPPVLMVRTNNQFSKRFITFWSVAEHKTTDIVLSDLILAHTAGFSDHMYLYGDLSGVLWEQWLKPAYRRAYYKMGKYSIVDGELGDVIDTPLDFYPPVVRSYYQPQYSLSFNAEAGMYYSFTTLYSEDVTDPYKDIEICQHDFGRSGRTCDYLNQLINNAGGNGDRALCITDLTSGILFCWEVVDDCNGIFCKATMAHIYRMTSQFTLVHLASGNSFPGNPYFRNSFFERFTRGDLVINANDSSQSRFIASTPDYKWGYMEVTPYFYGTKLTTSILIEGSHWDVSAWSECQLNNDVISEGFMERSLQCIDPNGQPTSNIVCESYSPMAPVQYCAWENTIDNWKVVMDFGEYQSLDYLFQNLERGIVFYGVDNRIDRCLGNVCSPLLTLENGGHPMEIIFVDSDMLIIVSFGNTGFHDIIYNLPDYNSKIYLESLPIPLTDIYELRIDHLSPLVGPNFSVSFGKYIPSGENPGQRVIFSNTESEGTTTVMGVYSDDELRVVQKLQMANIEQWANASTLEMGIDNESNPITNVLGLANAVLGTNVTQSTWSPMESNECLTVSFIEPTIMLELFLYEAGHPGALTKIEIKDPQGDWHIVWQGESQLVKLSPSSSSPYQQMTLFYPFEKVDYTSNAVRLSFEEATNYHIGIDAIKIVGQVEMLSTTSAPKLLFAHTYPNAHFNIENTGMISVNTTTGQITTVKGNYNVEIDVFDRWDVPITFSLEIDGIGIDTIDSYDIDLKSNKLITLSIDGFETRRLCQFDIDVNGVNAPIGTCITEVDFLPNQYVACGVSNNLLFCQTVVESCAKKLNSELCRPTATKVFSLDNFPRLMMFGSGNSLQNFDKMFELFDDPEHKISPSELLKLDTEIIPVVPESNFQLLLVRLFLGKRDIVFTTPKLQELHWEVGKWSQCSEECEGGTSTRSVACQSGDNIVTDAECATISTKPTSQKDCNTQLCSIWESNWTECSKTCGTGQTTQQWTCKDSVTSLPVSDDKCESISYLPTVSKKCNISECPIWIIDDWSLCSESCGGGTKTREVYCEYDETSTSDEVCLPHFPKPSSTEACNIVACPEWEILSDWTECSKSCGGGEQTRVVSCLQDGEESNDCTSTKPDSIQSCNNHICPLWEIVSDWSACSKRCNSGESTRTVICKQGNDIKDDSVCEPETKPLSSKACNTDACLEWEWGIGDWSSCSKECGTGIATRSVVCYEGEGIGSDNVCETHAPKPDTSTYCNTRPCPRWVIGNEWSSCSKDCGGGIATKSVKCQEGYYVTFHYKCYKYGAKPTPQKECNVEPCVNWEIGEVWSECSVSCGGGISERSVVCLEDETGVVADDKCESISTKPISSKECNTQICSVWEIETEWSDCSNEGFSTRSVSCKQGVNTVNDSNCVAISKPRTSKTCDPRENYHWKYGKWSDCSEYCEGGISTRVAVCADAVDNTLADSECNNLDLGPKPVSESKTCNEMDCFRYDIGEWSSCSEICGDGTQSRYVDCISVALGNKVVDISNCANYGPVPATEKSCNKGVCEWMCMDMSIYPTSRANCNTCSLGSTIPLCCPGDIVQYCGLGNLCDESQKPDALCGNPCKDTDCGLNGLCMFTLGTQSYCNCNIGYSGDHCEVPPSDKPIYFYEAGPWEKCSEECGSSGTKTRDLVCKVVMMGNGAETTKPSEICSSNNILKPKTATACNIFSCEVKDLKKTFALSLSGENLALTWKSNPETFETQLKFEIALALGVSVENVEILSVGIGIVGSRKRRLTGQDNSNDATVEFVVVPKTPQQDLEANILSMMKDLNDPKSDVMQKSALLSNMKVGSLTGDVPNNTDSDGDSGDPEPMFFVIVCCPVVLIALGCAYCFGIRKSNKQRIGVVVAISVPKQSNHAPTQNPAHVPVKSKVGMV